MTQFDDRPDPEAMGRAKPEWTRDKADRLARWSAEIRAALERDPLYVDGGFDYAGPAVQVYYAGELPASLDQVIEAARADGVSIVGVRARFGAATLHAAGKRLLEALQHAGIVIHSMGFGTPDEGINSGLTVGAASMDDEERILAVAERVVSGIPVVVQHSRGPLITR